MIPLDAYRGNKVAVFGLGKSGGATVAACILGGAEVYAWDDHEKSRAQVISAGSTLHLVPPESWPWKELAFMVLSPGIPLTHPEPHAVVKQAQANGCEVIGDIELLHRACPAARKCGITGTNGKSTTTALLGHVLQSNQRNVRIGGNLGPPVLSLAPLDAGGTYVLELSSYQLDLMSTTCINSALLLNITPDHTDRHGGMDGYIKAKLRIFDRQEKKDAAVIAVDDTHTQKIFAMLAARKHQRVIPVSVTQPLEQGVYVDASGTLHDCMDGKESFTFDLTPIVSLTGRHNWQNAAAAYAMARLEGLEGKDITHAMKSFPGLPHRMELVGEMNGVRFINDSKATNAEAAENALKAYDTIYWIAGGLPKEGGITMLMPWMKHVVHAFLIGKAEDDFAKTLEGTVPFTKCGTLEKALNEAAKKALADRKTGAVVLLSPACASFDQWPNFEARGDAFRTLARQLTHTKAAS